MDYDIPVPDADLVDQDYEFAFLEQIKELEMLSASEATIRQLLLEMGQDDRQHLRNDMDCHEGVAEQVHKRKEYDDEESSREGMKRRCVEIEGMKRALREIEERKRELKRQFEGIFEDVDEVERGREKRQCTDDES
ncbi:MAG: hypothetical protein Terrestrivirus5_154 [Terrestrivirus sp.]|uniref:Uncharacterized protein n=1 Tax=Terrestrivirus sp. TaxID=2487775 RepID=A0A3G4ZN94_9VIRU|nr:MAG: hypothetical protein Terrestrivirus5_154 [Terrestrivirus sp.]